MTNEEKAQALLGSPAGCALILDLSANPHLPLERFAEPKVSFWLAATAIEFTNVHRDAGWSELALRKAGAYYDLALKVVRHPALTSGRNHSTPKVKPGRRSKCRSAPTAARCVPSPPNAGVLPGPPDPRDSSQHPADLHTPGRLHIFPYGPELHAGEGYFELRWVGKARKFQRRREF